MISGFSSSLEPVSYLAFGVFLRCARKGAQRIIVSVMPEHSDEAERKISQKDVGMEMRNRLLALEVHNLFKHLINYVNNPRGGVIRVLIFHHKFHFFVERYR